MKARWRSVVTLGLLAVMLVPLFRNGDGVPLSSYPMYAYPRSAEITFVVAAGQQANGEQVRLSPRVIADTSDPLLVESYLRREVESGRADQLCSAIAGRVTDDRVAVIEIRAERQHVIDRIQGRDAGISSEVLASCLVP